MQPKWPVVLGLVVGLMFISGGIFILATTAHLIRDGVRSTGHIVGIERHYSEKRQEMYAPIFEFSTPDGQEHRFTSKMSSNYKPVIGSVKPILYNAKKPEDAVENNTFDLYIFPGIFISLGALVALLSLLPVFLSIRDKHRSKRLQAMGHSVQALVTGVVPTSYRINKKPLYRIHAQVLQDGTAKRFYRSSLLWFDPSEQVKGKEITVFQNPDRADDYWVDTDFLIEQKRAQERQ